MSLISQFSPYFDSAIRQRGGEYYRNGRVNIKAESDSRIVAAVQGSSRYQVELKREGRTITASCTCPYDDIDLCKHVWAVMMATEKLPFLQGASLDGRLGLVHHNEEGDFDDDWDDEDEGEENHAALKPRRIYARSLHAPRPDLARLRRELRPNLGQSIGASRLLNSIRPRSPTVPSHGRSGRRSVNYST